MSSIDELEIQYTPSIFSKRFSSRDNLLNHFSKFTFEGELKFQKEIFL